MRFDRRVEFENAGHMLALEQPEAVVNAMIDFIASPSDGSQMASLSRLGANVGVVAQRWEP